MGKISMITYLRRDEVFTEELAEICRAFDSKFSGFKCIIFSNIKLDQLDRFDFTTENYVLSGTKYKKIKYVIDNDDSDYLFSVDNDITGNVDEILHFVEKIESESYNVGWGKIQVREYKGIIDSLVVVDKLLSHYYLRPFLWRHNIGVTVPGQVFIINRKTFVSKLLEADTFLDDIALGLYINRNFKELKCLISSEILGYEKPKSTFWGLWGQRKRWANGFSVIYTALTDVSEKKLLLIHGFTYHGLWFLNYLIIFGWASINPIVALIYVLFISGIIVRGNMRLIVSGMIYQMFFPIFHVRWLTCL
jgi:cellulose synthase/poly-beta-1,6-N-acetylglucosamine synthase-like glycosyltransferase